MAEKQERNRRTTTAQTKALAGLVAIMIAAAIVALVFVADGGGKSTSPRAGGRPSDVAHNSTSAPAPSTPVAKASGSPRSAAPSATHTPAARASSSAPASHSSSSSAGKIVYYTVRRGDTLIGIGRWFRDHGYLTLYQWNKSVIGRNPNLIFPGQRIIVVAHHVGVARPVPSH